jgi:hypothetical protein
MRGVLVPSATAVVAASPRSPKSARLLGGLWTVLFGFLLICGVMAMHGLQASSSPAHASGVPTVSIEYAHVAHGEFRHGDSVNSKISPAESDGGAQHDQHHSGGEICLALLTLAAITVLLRLATRACKRGVRVAKSSSQRPLPRDAGRSPPPLRARSVVLRL